MIPRSRHRMEPQRTSGFTLIELIIALAILGIATTAIYTTFLSQYKSYSVQNAVAEMQQNLRGGMQFLEMHVRTAGGGIPSTAAHAIPTLLLGVGAIPIAPGLGISDAGPTASDNLYVIIPYGMPTHLTEPMPSVSAEIKVVDPTGFQEGMIAVISDSECYNVFQVTEVQGSNHLQHNPEGAFGMDNKNFCKAFGPEATVILANPFGYFIDTTTDPVHPKLMRNVLIDNTLRPEIVADDIEDLQVRLVLKNGTELDGYGIDSATLATLDVRQLRIYLAARTSVTDPQWNEGPRPWYNHTNLPAALTSYTHHRRRYYDQLIDLRKTGQTP